MKYSSSNKPLVCMQTQSTCYKGTRKFTPVGVLWHSTGANNPTLKRYVQPSDTKPSADTYSKAKWLEVLGTNTNKNDWNHIERQAGLNCWIGKLADGTVTTVQTMPWDYRPWGCGSGSKGSCNNGWIQFEICEDGLTDKTYFNKVYTEACEITAYLCELFNIDPKGTVTVNGVKIPTILCHQDSYKLGFGSNHSDVTHWFPKHGKSMETARADVAALMKKTITTTTESVNSVSTYKLVVDVNKYTTAADAKAKTNSKGTMKAGTYYIFNKYPNGYNGMYNLTTDKTGAAAGSWINPTENVAPKQEETVQKLYRVRTSWTDAKSQKGAFSLLENAKECCQTAGTGYKVYDWNGKEVYAYTAPTPVPTPAPQPEPEQPKQEETVKKAVYELDFPTQTKIVDKTKNSADDEVVKAIKYILTNNATFDIEIAKAFFRLAPKYGVDPTMAISQSILETGWFKYSGSAVKPEHHNYCGLGVTSNGVEGGKFATIEEGVTAQLQHLFAYGCKDTLSETIVDPRFKYVTRGIAPYWEQLAGRWAVPGFDGNDAEAAVKSGATYGQKILKIRNSLLVVTVSDEDFKKYFPTKEDEVKPIDPITPDDTKPEPEGNPIQPEDDLQDNKATDLAVLIFNVIKKLIIMIANLFSKGE
jgi:flagellum-specific peptidoglycan hydrolase FlgJ